MQGHVEEALTLFQKESPADIRSLPVENFNAMCSSLSFRYWNSGAEVKKVIKDIVPHFLEFFQRAGLSQDKIAKIMFVIFKRHLFYQNIFDWGPLVGRLRNYFLRRKNKYNAHL